MKPTILFVDDEIINLFVLKKRFENDYDVLTAESGEEALEIIKENETRIRAVISDLRMPGIDGLVLINQAKEILPNTPFFLLTGYENNEQINQALMSGLIADSLKKPFDYEIIHRKLQDSIKGD